MTAPTLSDKKAQTQDRILAVASRAIREHGYHGVGVADLMKEAGLTHGGFYAHFSSRNAMLVKAIERAAHDSGIRNLKARQRLEEQGLSPFAALVTVYLSEAHLDDTAQGCPIAALGSEVARQDEIVRQTSVSLIDKLQKVVASTLPKHANTAEASAVVATLIGTLQLARAQGNNSQGRATLAISKQFLLQQFDQ
jgi:TetR/AcrR family transcriptional regulator, transcriptional repressor for nem operon